MAHLQTVSGTVQRQVGNAEAFQESTLRDVQHKSSEEAVRARNQEGTHPPRRKRQAEGKQNPGPRRPRPIREQRRSQAGKRANALAAKARTIGMREEGHRRGNCGWRLTQC